ncbi:sensor histidine kinase [Geomobilimonas luticola]|jgi:signal transduction histidine kinase|uniref:histidine kinase n=1 Tax=Geomobilimonas luticola TaxID=1114878 RepID=A0ABS5SAU1_9BACT|nr:HAMP domain-containing sensor histidine kinase [Geomobilimonas luticola]MBT0652476.1 HAMP domain-containing histidine kinase [Geomobilimonas luticola]
MNKQTIQITAIVSVTTLILVLHLLLPQWGSYYFVLSELYYLPLVLGVLRFDFKGAFATYIFVSAAYVVGAWATASPQPTGRVLHLVFSGLVVLLVGILVDRLKKRHRQTEQERYFSGIGQVATVIVHDLKNPLISIQGFARRIQEGKGDTALAALTITKSAQVMQRIVNDVLEFARPVRLNPKKDDLRQSIQRACETCWTKAEEKGIKLIVTLPPETILSNIDSYQMERALINLIDNSVDASCHGGEVNVTATSDKNKMTITIKDYGEGMEQETLDNLFTLTYTTKNEGTGFGVPISKKIIEAHDGAIRISSKKHFGTEVLIDLPLTSING